VTLPLVTELAEIFGEHFGWTAKQKKAEAMRAAELLKDFHGVAL
jgi:hypothetical protein